MSDEIPVGSPPAPPGRHAAPGGWYPDPARPGQQRYWDGWQWSRNIRPAAASPPPVGHVGPVPPVAPPAAPAYAPPGYRAVPATADSVPLAGWWWRVLAYLIDAFLVSLVVGLISRLTGIQRDIDAASNRLSAYLQEVMTTGATFDVSQVMAMAAPPAAYIQMGLTVALWTAYSGLLLQAKGATLGKMACRLRVVGVDQGRSTPGLPAAKAWLRPLFTQVLQQFLVLVGLLDFLFPLWDRRRQALHDKVVGTQVVREARP